MCCIIDPINNKGRNMEILGTNDAVNTCDCCGKSNLKFTIAVSVNGELLHYGSTCATRHTGKTSGQINQAIATAKDARKADATRKYHAAPEWLAYQSKLSEATRAGVRPGRDFYAYVRAASQAAEKVGQAIAAAHNVAAWEIGA